MGGQRAYSEDEVAAMAVELARGRCGMRDRAAFLFGVMTGYRASEICSVRLGDVVAGDGSIVEAVTVWRRYVKRGKTRTVRICDELRQVLRAYVRARERAGVIHKDEYLFAKRGGGPITRHTLYTAQKRAAKRLELKGRVGGTHSMRKTFGKGVHEFLKARAAAGVPVDPLLDTKEAMGHSDVRSTEAYLQADAEQVVDAVMSLGRRFGAKLGNSENRE